MMQVNREDLVVARQARGRLFLAAGPRTELRFEGPSERTIFLPRKSAERELRRMRVNPDSVVLRPAVLSAQIS